VRSDGTSGFVFLNNFQDHDTRIDQPVSALNIKLTDESIRFPAFTLKRGVSAILPFNLPIEGTLLKYATAQPLAIVQTDGKPHYIFYAPDGIAPVYQFAGKKLRRVTPGLRSSFTLRGTDGKPFIVTTLTREQALGFNQWKEGFCITDATLLQNGATLCLQDTLNRFHCILPAEAQTQISFGALTAKEKRQGLFTEYTVALPVAQIACEVKEVSKRRYTFRLDKSQFTENLSDILLDIDYVGDNAVAFIDGRMINDHLYYGNTWQIGLKQYADEIDRKGAYFYFRPMPRNASYLIDFDADKRPVFEGRTLCRINGMRVIPEYEIRIEWRR
jgi:hypothetical protein